MPWCEQWVDGCVDELFVALSGSVELRLTVRQRERGICLGPPHSGTYCCMGSETNLVGKRTEPRKVRTYSTSQPFIYTCAYVTLILLCTICYGPSFYMMHS